MNFEVKQAILNKIKEYDTIFLFRHIRNDGDCVGATKGMKAILQASFPEKKIYLIDNDCSAYLSFLGPEDEEVDEACYAGALAIVLDTGTQNRISNKNFALCKELIKIDHHIPVDNYGDLNWVEEERSSACEMVVDFYDTFRDQLQLTKEAALYLYTGMVTDSGRFRYDSTSAQTFRLASFLMEQEFDTNEIFGKLYADDLGRVQMKAKFILKIQLTENRVAYIYTTREEMEELKADTFSISRGMVGTMSDIKGVDIWVNFTETERGVLCELRSSRFNINPVAVKYGGGGHAKASGATVRDRAEAMAMLADLDATMEEAR